jgi:hypothetical protein
MDRDAEAAMQRRSTLALAVVVATAAAVAGGLFLAAGDRHRLYWDPQAGHCWSAIEALALSSSSLRPLGIAVDRSGADGSTRVTIDYRLDRALGGAALEAVCIYDAGERRARSIVLGGMPIDADTLRLINRGAD